MAGGICGKGELLVGLAEAYQCRTRKWMFIVLCAKNQNGCLFVFNLRLIHGTFEKLRISLVEFSDHLGGSVEIKLYGKFLVTALKKCTGTIITVLEVFLWH